MDNEFWLDGFNYFHHWERTRDLFQTGGAIADIAKTIDKALRILSRELGSKRDGTLVFLDGGLTRRETRQAGLRVRYCGPGNKADDRMVEDLIDLGDDARQVTAVSNDRELKARLTVNGAACLGIGEFLAILEKKRVARSGKGQRGGGDSAAIMREKCRNLSAAEVQAWLELFGGDSEA